MRHLLFAALACLFPRLTFAQPANDNACDATLVSVDSVCSGNAYSNAQATLQMGEPADCWTEPNSVWFKFAAPASGAVRIASMSSEHIRKSLYAVGDCADFGTFTTLQCTGFGEDIWHSGLTPGAEYWLRIQSETTAASFCLEVHGLVSMPANDAACAAALLQVDSTCTGNPFLNTTATRQTGEPNSCGYEAHTIWFKFAAPSTGAVRVSTTGQDLATSMFAVAGSCGNFANFTELGCTWNAPLEVGGLMPDSVYYIQSTNLFGSTDTFCLSLETIFPPANDSACAATLLTVGSGCTDAPYSLSAATSEAGEPDSCYSSVQTAWFKFVVPSTGAVEVGTWSPDFWTFSELYTVGDCGDFSSYIFQNCAGYDDYFQAAGLTPGDTAFVKVGTNTGNTGAYCITVDSVFQWFADFDGDGYGDPFDWAWASTQPTDYVLDSTDCDGAAANIHPGATETCDGYDEDCDGQIDDGVGDYFFADTDGDGFGNAALDTLMCSGNEDFVADNTDCNDTNDTVFPNAPELCDGSDNDCDGQIDENTPTWFADADGDGFGNAAIDMVACDPGTGWVLDSTDCDDAAAGIHPGAAETCDGLDQNCNGQTDEGVLQTFYVDADGDTFGSFTETQEACSAPSGYVSNFTDCDDNDAANFPGRVGSTISNPFIVNSLPYSASGNNLPTGCWGNEIGYNSHDVWYKITTTDCGTLTASLCGATDFDSYITLLDADENYLVWNNDFCGTRSQVSFLVDSNTTYYVVVEGLLFEAGAYSLDITLAEAAPSSWADADGDGFGDPTQPAPACTQPAGYVANSGDCNDANPDIHPGMTETCNSTDDDCDGTTDEGFDIFTYYADADGDNWGSTVVTVLACAQPSGYTYLGYDCDDANATIHPYAPELCDNLDNDCDGDIDEGAVPFFFADADGDGFGDYAVFVQTCSQPTGYVSNYSDCNDANANINPNAPETCNGLDDDCDGGTDEGAGQWFYADNDGDGYGNSFYSQFACTAPSGYVLDFTDCNDNPATGGADIHPGVAEVCDGIDQDCDGQVDEGVAQNIYQDSDGDGYGSSYWGGFVCTVPTGWAANDDDCNDANANIHPGATEICENNLDENCDGSDEICPPTTANDLGVESILSPSANAPFALGSQSVRVVIRNFGSDIIETATIKWTFDNVPQTDFAYSGAGLSPNGRDTITIGTAVFGFGAHTISARTFEPDGMADGLATNDEHEVSNLYAALNGTYTIGGPMSDFLDFAAATEQLNNGGVLGPVTMNIRNGTYPERVVLGEIPGSSSQNTLLFQSESGDSSAVKLVWDSDDVLLLLDGTDYTTFKQISIEANTGLYDAILLQNGANHIEISNCDLTLGFLNSSGAVIKSDNFSEDSYLTVQNCRLENGLYGIYAHAQMGQMESGAVVENNEFVNPKNAGIYLAYQNAPKVNRNRVQLGQYGNTGIYLFVCSVGTEVLKNKIFVPSGSGLNVYGLAGTAGNPVLIANNFISVGEGYVGNNEQRGVEIYQSSHVNFYHNTVRVAGTSPGTRALYNYFSNNNKLINNVLASVGTGGHVIYNASAGIGISQSNHNVLFSGGANLGYWAGTTAANLADWQTASGHDLNSISEDPFFFSPTDLHVQNINLDGAGLAVAGVGEDIDGETRHATTPDIGADEFMVFPNNAGVVEILSPENGCGLGSQSVTVRIRNYTAGPLSGFDVAHQLNGGAEVVENVGGFVVPANATADYTFSQNANFTNYGLNDLTARTMVAGDGFAGNDAQTKSIANGEPLGNLSNFLPADGAANVKPTQYSGYAFSWSAVTNATAYDFYLWADGDGEPTTPIYANQTAINVFYNLGNLVYGETYHWRVVPKNEFCDVPGPVLTFTVAQLPNLELTSITVPPTVFSGQNVEISWEVTNIGAAETGLNRFWYDEIYISDDTILDLQTDTRLGYRNNFSALLPQQNYTNTASFFIPNGISGDFYILVRTNYIPTLVESDYSNNLKHSATPIDINLSNYSDLTIPSANAPVNAFGGQNFPITWTVKNVGPGHTDKSVWVDRILLTQDTLSMSGAVQIASKTRFGILEPDSSYTVTLTTANLPLSAYGDYFLVLQTDALNNVWEFVYETNNRHVLPLTMLLTPPPDLYVTDVDLPDTIHYGQVVPFGHTLTNQGTGPTPIPVSNNLSLSADPDTTTYTFTNLGTVDFGVLSQNQTVSKTKNVQIPLHLQPGDYYGYVRTDQSNSIFEYDKEDNNISRTQNAVKLIAPDLIVTDLEVPASASGGEVIVVNWTLRNNSFGGIYNAPSKAVIYFSESNAPGSLSSAVQYPFDFTLNLAPHDTVSRAMPITVPCGLTTGNYYVFVKEDVLNEVIEIDDLNNLSDPPAPIAVQYADCPAFDFEISTLTTPNLTLPCLEVTVDYTVKNLSTTTQGRMLCKDYVYLSTDETLNFGDVVLDKIDRSINLQPEASIDLTATVRIPELPTTGGTYHLLVSLGNDCSPSVPFYDSNPNNNIKTSTPIEIPAIQPPDLIVESLVAPESGQSGQPLQLEYTVKNDGAGSTNVTHWVDKIYLSATPFVNPLGQGPNQWPLATIARNSALGGGQDYTQSGGFNIPLYVPTGNYYVVIISDFNDNVCEWDNDGNNQKSQYIFVQQPPPSDLVVTNVINTDTVMAGDTTTMTWTVRNEGANSAIGTIKHVIYLSADPEWDISDVVIGDKISSVSLNPGQSADYQSTLRISGAGVGNYYVLVRTDARDQIYESDNTNNVSSGGDLLTVTVKELVLDVPTPDVLAPNEPLFYRIEIPAGLAGETLVASLTTPDSVAASNQLYLRYGNVPTASAFDFSFNNPIFGNQESVVPVLQAGTYYLMALGNKEGGGPQNINLLAHLRPFEITSVESNKGGNTGFTTVQITGAKFTPDMVVSLLGDTTIVADTIYYISPVKVFARFNLNGAPIGSFNMEAVKPGIDTTVRGDAFEVVQGAPNNLLVEFKHPPRINLRAVVGGAAPRWNMIAQYKNAGLNDIPIPEIPVESIGGAPISLSSHDLATTGGSLQVLVRCVENNGPTDVLRAGAEGSVIVYMLLSNAPLFIAKIPD